MRFMIAIDIGSTGYAVVSSMRTFHAVSAGKTVQPPMTGAPLPLDPPAPVLAVPPDPLAPPVIPPDTPALPPAPPAEVPAPPPTAFPAAPPVEAAPVDGSFEQPALAIAQTTMPVPQCQVTRMLL